MAGLVFLAALIGAGILLVTLIGVVIGWVKNTFDAIDLPRTQISEGEFWGCYGVYAAVVLFAVVLMDKSPVVRGRWGWFQAGLVAVVFVVVPLILLMIPQNITGFTSFGQFESVDCGSWLSPSVGELFGGNLCTAAFNQMSRYALTVAAVGVAGPFVVMALAIRRENKAQ